MMAKTRVTEPCFPSDAHVDNIIDPSRSSVNVVLELFLRRLRVRQPVGLAGGQQ
jgi:hypothetical protein